MKIIDVITARLLLIFPQTSGKFTTLSVTTSKQDVHKNSVVSGNFKCSSSIGYSKSVCVDIKDGTIH